MTKITISVNDEIIELTGKEAEEFEKARAIEHAEFLKSKADFEAAQLTQVEAKNSAKTKLMALGLSDDEIKSIIGE